jgi:hypothetical protein
MKTKVRSVQKVRNWTFLPCAEKTAMTPGNISPEKVLRRLKGVGFERGPKNNSGESTQLKHGEQRSGCLSDDEQALGIREGATI